MRVILLKDYRDKFWLSTNNFSESMDLSILKKVLSDAGHEVLIIKYSEIDFNKFDYSNDFIFYQSTEDDGLLYKSYIEDILLGLKLRGAILVPDYIYLRAHHNKAFMEVLRQVSKENFLNSLNSKVFGTYEDALNEKINFPAVFKPAAGAQSRNIHLIKSKSDLKKIKKLTRSFNLTIWLKDHFKTYFKKKYNPYIKKSHHRKKFILQEYLPGLSNDYKVVVINNHYFVLDRKVRQNDFRASGSGKFSFENTIPLSLLDFAKQVYEYFKVPFISLDIAVYQEKYHLIEFQFTSFGTYTVGKSPHHWIRNNNVWEKITGKVIVEELMADSIIDFIKTSGGDR